VQGAEAGARGADQQIASLIAIKNEEEVALNRLASQHAQNDQVKQFAQQMVQEHGQMLQQLQKFAPNAGKMLSGSSSGGGASSATSSSATSSSASGSESPGNAPRQTRNQSATGDESGTASRTPSVAESGSVGELAQSSSQSTQRGARNQSATGDESGTASRTPSVAESSSVSELSEQAGGQGGSQQGLNFVQIHQQIAQECVKSAQQELGQKQGAEFDMAFMGQQLVLHQQMLDSLKVLRQHASQELQQGIEQGMETTQQHLSHAKKIVDSLAATEGQQLSAEKRAGADRGSSSTSSPNRSSGQSGSSQSGNRGGNEKR